MPRTNKDRILDHLRSVAPRRVTNSDIREATDVRPHQQVFQITQKLRESGVIQAARRGREWVFWIDEPSTKPAHRLGVVNGGKLAVHAGVLTRLRSSSWRAPL